MQDWMFEIGADPFAPTMTPDPWAPQPTGWAEPAPAFDPVVDWMDPLFVPPADDEEDPPYELEDVVVVARNPNQNGGGPPPPPPPPPWTPPPPPPPPPVDPTGPGGGSGGGSDGHVYINRSAVGDTSCDADEAWEGLLRNAAPGQSSPATTGMIVDVPGLGPVVQTVNWETMTVTNTTLPGHILFPGIVTRHVVSYGGEIMIETLGYGLGPLSAPNSYLAGDLWRAMDLMIAVYVDQNDDGEGDC